MTTFICCEKSWSHLFFPVVPTMDVIIHSPGIIIFPLATIHPPFYLPEASKHKQLFASQRSPTTVLLFSKQLHQHFQELRPLFQLIRMRHHNQRIHSNRKITCNFENYGNTCGYEGYVMMKKGIISWCRGEGHAICLNILND